MFAVLSTFAVTLANLTPNCNAAKIPAGTKLQFKSEAISNGVRCFASAMQLNDRGAKGRDLVFVGQVLMLVHPEGR